MTLAVLEIVRCLRLVLLFFVGVVVGCGAWTDAAEEEDGEGTQSAEVRFSESRLTLSRGDSSSPHPGDAYWMARLSALAYDDSIQLWEALHKLGAVGGPSSEAARNEFAVFANSSTGTEGFFLGTATHAILVFRGTELTLTDLVTDARRLRTTTPFGLVHAGFYDAFRSIWDDDLGNLVVGGAAKSGEGMRSFLLRRSSTLSSSRPLFIAGHSLGGALATLAAVHLGKGEGRKVSALYTFGAPRIGDETFGAHAASLGAAASRTFRYTNMADPVVALPYFGYWHPHERRDENARLLGLGGRAWGHGIASYIANLRDLVPRDLEIPDVPSPQRARARRWADAIFDEKPALEVGAELRSPARRELDAFALAGLQPAALATTIDGTRVDIVQVSMEESGHRMNRFLLFDGSSFVVEVGFIDDARYMHEVGPRNR